MGPAETKRYNFNTRAYCMDVVSEKFGLYEVPDEKTVVGADCRLVDSRWFKVCP
jgi:hypothetical protein